jgi:uncharacterized protein with NRDE domain
MCLIAFSIGTSPRWPLVIAANRDEFLDRPTLPLASWKTGSGREIISGRDLRAGGTWLGTTPGGRVAFLTNVREAKPAPAPRSRGELVTRWLEADGDAASFIAALDKESGAYGGFNLVLGDFQQNAWTWVTNKAASSRTGWHAQTLAPGVHGLSNAALDTPWPKTMQLKRVLAEALAPQANAPDINALQAPLWTALVSRERSPREQLPSTCVALAMEEALSSVFVDVPEHAYGTRSSTVLVATEARIQVEERTHLREKPQQAVRTFTSSAMAIDWPLPSKRMVWTGRLAQPLTEPV